MVNVSARIARRALIALLLVHAVANAARVVLSLRQDLALAGVVNLTTPPGYLAIYGAVWSLIFFLTTWLVATQRSAVARVTISTAVIYQASWWLNQVAFARSSEAWERAGFMALWSVLIIFATAFLAWLSQHKHNPSE